MIKTIEAGRISELDGLRGIAIILVLIWHYYVSQINLSAHNMHGLFTHALMLSWSGVDLFFVLSGFLIGGKILDNRDSSNFYSVFYARRACRIFPIYFLWIGLFYSARFLHAQDPFPWLFDHPLPLLSYLTYTQNFVAAVNGSFGANWLGITWTLAIEEQFYLLFPLVIRLFPKKHLSALLLSLIAFAPVIRTTLYFLLSSKGFVGHVLLPGRWDALLLGVFIAHLLRKPDAVKTIINNLPKITTCTYLSLAGIAALILFEVKATSLGMTIIGYTLLSVFYTLTLVTVVFNQK